MSKERKKLAQQRFSENLKKIRMGLGFAHASQFAHELGFHENSYRRWEVDTNPPLEFFWVFAERYGKEALAALFDHSEQLDVSSEQMFLASLRELIDRREQELLATPDQKQDDD